MKWQRKERRPVRVEGDVAYVTLTRGLEAIIDAEDAEMVSAYNWYGHPAGSTFYASRGVMRGGLRQCIFLHREILGAPKDFHVDHVNGDGLDNRKANLRLVTPAQNAMNSRTPRDNTSGFKGVSREKRTNKWRAQIRVPDKSLGSNGKVYLGTFDTPEEAYAAYCHASKVYHGEFGRV